MKRLAIILALYLIPAVAHAQSALEWVLQIKD